MRFNPFHHFTDHPMYSKNFREWMSDIYALFINSELSRDRITLSLLDYFFIFPALIKLIVDSYGLNIFLLTILSFFMGIESFVGIVFTIAFTPLIYLAYRCARYQAKKFLGMEGIAVSEEDLAALKYDKNELTISKEALLHKFGDNQQREARVRLKDYRLGGPLQNVSGLLQYRMQSSTYLLGRGQYLENIGGPLQNNMRGYKLNFIRLKKENEDINADEPTEEILGLFRYIRYQDIENISHEPVLVIIPSKDNAKAIRAIKELDAFYFSDAFRPTESIENWLTDLDQKPDVLKQFSLRRHTAQCTVQQALADAVKNVPIATLINAIDDLMPEITQFTGLGVSADDNHSWNKFNAEHPTFFKNPNTLWVTEPTPITAAATEFKKQLSASNPAIDLKRGEESVTSEDLHSPSLQITIM